MSEFGSSGTYTRINSDADTIVLALTPNAVPEPPAIVPIPGKAEWERRMLELGRKFGRPEYARNINEQYTWYYDGSWVFRQIMEYTHQNFEGERAQCESVYYPYALGQPTGYRVFPHGFEMGYSAGGRHSDRYKVFYGPVLLNLANRSAYGVHSAAVIAEWLKGAHRSREAAYLLQALLACKRCDLGREVNDYDARVNTLIDLIIGHFDQWFDGKTSTWMQPFMVGLSAHALIEYATEYPGWDGAALILSDAATWLRDNAWNEERGAFYLSNDRPYEPWADRDGLRWAQDLNMLVAPIYAWLWKETGDAQWRDFGDKVFESGTRCEINNGKQFSQNYRLSFLYVKWREERS